MTTATKGEEGRTLRAEELAGDVEGLAADNDNLLAIEELLGDDAGQTAEQVALAIDDDLETETWSAIVLLGVVVALCAV